MAGGRRCDCGLVIQERKRKHGQNVEIQIEEEWREHWIEEGQEETSRRRVEEGLGEG